MLVLVIYALQLVVSVVLTGRFVWSSTSRSPAILSSRWLAVIRSSRAVFLFSSLLWSICGLLYLTVDSQGECTVLLFAIDIVFVVSRQSLLVVFLARLQIVGRSLKLHIGSCVTIVSTLRGPSFDY